MRVNLAIDPSEKLPFLIVAPKRKTLNLIYGCTLGKDIIEPPIINV